jgi:hypothetical protein
MDERLNDAEWLAVQYETRSLQSIADELGVHRNTVRNRFEALGIERRNRGAHFKGVPKSPDQRAKMSAARKRFWDDHPDRTMHRIKVSQAKRKAGTRDGRPYVYVIGRGYVAEHVIVAETTAGRAILPGEHVHHKDGDKANNHPDNLEILAHSEHGKIHYADRAKDENGRLLPVGSENRLQPAYHGEHDKECTRCHQIKPRSEFSPYRTPKATDPHTAWCKACSAERARLKRARTDSR